MLKKVNTEPKTNNKFLLNIVHKFGRVAFLFLVIVLSIFSFIFSFGKEQEEQIIPSDEKKQTEELKLGFITDLHAKSNSIENIRSNRKIKDQFINIIEHFRSEMIQNFHPDAIINNGDVIEGTNRDYVVGMGELDKIKLLFDESGIPIYWIVGNHDLRAVNKQQWKESLGIDYLFHAFQLKGYRIIILDSNFDNFGKINIEPGRYFTRGRLNELQLNWLEAELNSSPQKTLIFIHHPPLLSSDINNSHSQLLFNAQEFQDIVSASDNVLAVFSGHIEELHHKIKNGIHYFIIPGTTKNPDFKKTFSEITLKNDEIQVKITYQDIEGHTISRNIEDLD